MSFVEALSRLWSKKSTAPVQPVAQPKAKPSTTLDCRPGEQSDDTTLGVKYVCRYSWQMTPPAGWRRQENTSSLVWPNGGLSPSVAFLNPILPAGEQAIIRWQLAAINESDDSHRRLEALLSSSFSLSPQSIVGLEAPGLVTGLQVQKVEKVLLPSQENALLIQGRLQQCKGEPDVLRYVLVLPDRKVIRGGQTEWYREALQFVATEDSFWTYERLAIRSIKTFRRSLEDQSSSYIATLTNPAVRS